jgi:hypothetical protein
MLKEVSVANVELSIVEKKWPRGWRGELKEVSEVA